jgi:CRP-like cAMP-binding protein
MNLLQSVSSSDLVAARLERLGSLKRAAAHTALFGQGDPPQGVYIVIHGTVELSLDAGGRRFLNRVAGPGEIIGLPAAISGEPYSLDATALEDCELLFVARETILAAISADPPFGTALLDILAHEVHRLREVWREEYGGKAATLKQ